MRAASVIGVMALGSGCVPRYNVPAPVVFDHDLKSADHFPYSGNNAALNSVNDTYTRTDARCRKVQGGMQGEVDGIETRNLAVAASFAAVAAGLATTSGIYTLSKKDDADPTISAVLALGAGASTAPTFFYFGSDERANVVKERVTKIEERRKTTNEAWRAVKRAQSDYDDSGDKLSIATGKYKNQCENAKPPDECEALKEQVRVATATDREMLSKVRQAIDLLDDAVRQLSAACQ